MVQQKTRDPIRDRVNSFSNLAPILFRILVELHLIHARKEKMAGLLAERSGRRSQSNERQALLPRAATRFAGPSPGLPIDRFTAEADVLVRRPVDGS